MTIDFGSSAAARLARKAVELVLRDLHATTDARPIVEVGKDAEYGLIVSCNGGCTTPAFDSPQHPESTAELADYLQGEIVDDNYRPGGFCSSILMRSPSTRRRAAVDGLRSA